MRIGIFSRSITGKRQFAATTRRHRPHDPRGRALPPPQFTSQPHKALLGDDGEASFGQQLSQPLGQAISRLFNADHVRPIAILQRSDHLSPASLSRSD